MRIVWCSWKDRGHPQAGGAEVVTDHILRRLVADGHDVTLLTADYPGAVDSTEEGVKVIHRGGRFTVYYHVWQYYRKHLRGEADLVVDEMNTLPFFASLYAGTRSVMMVHQLARQIWFYQLPWFIGWVGYLLEPIYLFMLSKQPVITVSHSTKNDLMRYGFASEKITIISEGIEMGYAPSLDSIKKYKHPTMLSLGAMRAMKRTLDQVKAFELAKSRIPGLRLKIAGDSNDPYGKKVLEYIHRSPYRDDIEYLGRVSAGEKLELMMRSHCIAVTSVKEGWGLIVSEAAGQGTPAAVYNVDGLRDSVNAGLIVKQNTPASLADAIAELLAEPERYEAMRRAGWEATKRLTFDQCYRDFTRAIKELA